MSTKIPAVVDALGNPLRWILTGGEVAEFERSVAGDALFISGAPTLDLDSLLSAFLRAINTTRQQGLQTDVNLRIRDPRGQASGICR